MRGFPARLRLLGLAALLLACAGDKASEAQIAEAVMVYADLLGVEVTNLFSTLTTAAPSALNLQATQLKTRESALTISTCPEGIASGCTTWCPTTKTITRVCETSSDTARTCGTTSYKVSNTKANLLSDISDLTRELNGYKGVLKVTYDFSGSYTGPTDTASRRVKCRAVLDVGVTLGQIVTRSLDCQQFTCSIGGLAVGCHDFQVALDAQSCGKAGSGSGGGGGSDSGGTTPVVVGSCTQSSSSRCQDFTGSVWSATLVQSHCTNVSGTYAATACPTAGRVGSCKISAGSPDELTLRFYAPDDATTAQAACTTQSGVWSAG